MIKLHQFPGAWGMSSMSPYCAKLAAFFRFANIPFQEMNTINLRQAPRKKLPYIELDTGAVMTDSQVIMEYFLEQASSNIDADLSDEIQAQYRAIRALVEDQLMPVLVYSRWVDPEGWAVIKPFIFKKAPGLLRNLIAGRFQHKVKKYLYTQGLGRRTPAEIYHISKQDLTSLSILLGNKPFWGGDRPCSLDASVYGLLGNIAFSPLPTALNRQFNSFPNLVAYCQRLQQAYFQQGS